MAIDSSITGRFRMPTPQLSGRGRAALQHHQRRVEVLQRELHAADRVLAGALTACDGASQQEMLGTYLEAVQELRVSLQRLEAFLLQRLVDSPTDELGAGPEARPADGLASPPPTE